MMADSNKNVHQQQPDEKESTPESENIAVAAARGTFLSFILKFVSFGTSQIIFRVVDPTTLGTASIQFELLLNTALFLSREGFRLALIRQSSTEKINNVIWLTLPMGLALSVFAFGIHFYSCSRQNYGYYYELTGSLYCISAFIETLAEPLLIQCCFMNTTSFRNMNSRAYAEGTATLLKGISCVYFLLSFSDTTDSNNIDVLAFGYSQLVYAIAFSSIMYHRLWNQIIWPISTSLDYQTIYMVFVFTFQGIFKHLLTEGDRIILTALASGYDKGVYAMTSSYGGLVSRLVFSSLEENARLLFSRQAATLSSSQETEKQKIKKEIELVYCTILKLVLYIGFTFAFLATNYSHVLLSILTSGRGGGSKWGLPFQTEASDALSAFCIYTAFLALNGTTEAFVYGVASHGTDVGKLGISHAFGKKDLHNFFRILVIFNSTYLLFFPFSGCYICYYWTYSSQKMGDNWSSRSQFAGYGIAFDLFHHICYKIF